MTEKKEPQKFTDFARNAVSVLSDALKRRPPQRGTDDVGELRRAVEKARRTREFLASQYYGQDLEPLLRELEKSYAMKPWRPGDPVTDEKFRAEYYFTSGLVAGVAEIPLRMQIWIEEGAVAEERLRVCGVEEKKP